ncbi:hypothetical protein L6452_09281 [Arctium lappa]|uniref:Uncharacterized protein n=1 Tax=Arctium lappa TaxID=4217 RepID=A0ACB9DJM2_ARCLA|nr:hypothetical protein L6452_09281 [Arctium lappa]
MSSKFKTPVYNSNKKDSENIVLIPRIIVDGKEIVPEIPRKEAEQDRLKDQNSELLKQIQELKSKLSNSDKTLVCTKCIDHVKSNSASIISAKENEIREKEKEIREKEREIKEREKIIVLKEKTIVTCEKELKLKERKITNLQSQLKTTEQKLSDLQDESVKLQNKFKAFEEKIYVLEIQNVELSKSIQADKEKSNLETSSTQKISDFSKKTLEEKKDLELRCIKLSKQVSDFEKILITERDIFAKEKQVLENKITELPNQISTLQDLLEKERKCFKENKRSYELEKKNAEKRNIGIFKDISEKTKNLEKDFEQERSHFESEISKLTSKLTALSSDYQKEQKARSDLTHKFDRLTSERNILAAKIKDLEAANVNLSEKITADVIDQSPVDNST